MGGVCGTLTAAANESDSIEDLRLSAENAEKSRDGLKKTSFILIAVDAFLAYQVYSMRQKE